MKKTLGTLGLVALGVAGLSSFVSGQGTQTSQSQLIIDCGSAEFTVEVSDLDFGTVTSSLAGTTDQAGTWQTGTLGDGISVKDTYAGCSTTGTSWTISMSFTNLSGSNTNALLSLAGSAGSLVDGSGNGDIRIAANQTAGAASASANLTLLDGIESSNVTATSLSDSSFATDTAQNVLVKGSADTINGVYQLQPTMDIDLPGGLLADTYLGSIDVNYPAVP